MPLYRFKAIDPQGETFDGQMQARDGAAVIARLQDEGHLPIEAEELREKDPGGGAAGRLGLGGVKRQEVTLFTQELAMLLKAGVSLERALGILSQDLGSDRLDRVIKDLRSALREGESFSRALGGHPRSFPPVYINMIAAAEASGTLELVLDRLADYRERAERLREKITGAMIYPSILILTSVASLILLLALVVPQFERLFADAGAALPAPTQVVIALARFLETQGLTLLLALALLLLFAHQLLRLPGPRLAFDRRLLSLPLLGEILRQLLAARFCRTFGTLLSNGVDLPLALELSRDVTGNRWAVRKIDEAILAVRQGQGLAKPLSGAGILPGMAVQMLRVGEETGNLWPTALHIAEVYERKVEQGISRFFALLVPSLIITVGLTIAGIISSILLAVVSINDLAF